MIRDFDQLTENPFADRHYDVCICGTGFAGIALALSLPQSLKILLLEGGGLDFEERSQAVYRGQVTGHPYFNLDATRLRQFGGTSGLWNGWCRPLDARDFKARPKLGVPAWPIGIDDLAPYLARAQDFLDVREHLDDWGDAMPRMPEFKPIQFAWSSPTLRIASKYRDQLRDSANIDCVLNANLTDVVLGDDLRRVTDLEVRNYNGLVSRAQANTVVLAAGGIENPRLLLNFNHQKPAGLGNDRGLVGRYFHEHPHFVAGNFVLEDHVAYRLARAQRPRTRILLTEFLTPDDAFMARHDILTFSMRVVHTNANRGLDFGDKMRRALCTSETLRPLADELPGDLTECHQDPFYNGGGEIRDGFIKMISGSAPSADSRVALGEERDRFGMRRANLDWRLGDAEKRTVKTAMLAIAREFAAQRVGRVQIYDWVLDDAAPFPGFPQEIGGHHHLGATRMGRSAEDGVVDSDLRVFGLDNLYVAGCSVFTAGGHANPTLSIVQLAMRLADHIAAKARAA